MSLLDGNGGGLSAADVAAVTGNNDGWGGGNAAWWIIILALFALSGNGWGGFGGNGGGVMPWMVGNTQSDVQRGFDQSAIMASLSGITNGLANAEVSRCNAQTNILQTLGNNQAAITAQMNAIAMNQQNCCCENRQQVADLKYTMANEAAATRVNDNANAQRILDKLCQLEMDGIKQNYENRIAGMQNTIDALRNDLGFARSDASQNAQTAQIIANNEAQTTALEQYLNPTPVPAYVVQNPSCCQGNWVGCGCGASSF